MLSSTRNTEGAEQAQALIVEMQSMTRAKIRELEARWGVRLILFLLVGGLLIQVGNNWAAHQIPEAIYLHCLGLLALASSCYCTRRFLGW